MLSFDRFAIFTVKCNDSAIKDRIASFQLKEIVLFLN